MALLAASISCSPHKLLADAGTEEPQLDFGEVDGGPVDAGPGDVDAGFEDGGVDAGLPTGTCWDGTPHNTCSLVTSALCWDGGLTPSCGSCPCASGLTCNPNGTCGAPGADLDVTYIERDGLGERYVISYFADQRGCTYPFPSDQGPIVCNPNAQRWPDAGQPVKFTGHVRNKGLSASPPAPFRLQILGPSGEVVATLATGSIAPLAPGEEVFVAGTWPWAADPAQPALHRIELAVDPDGTIVDDARQNDHRAEPVAVPHYHFYVEEDLYAVFNGMTNGVGTRSFEDWLQWQIDGLNQAVAQTSLPGRPTGSRFRARVNQISVVPVASLPCTSTHSPSSLADDGVWGWGFDHRPDGGCVGYAPDYPATIAGTLEIPLRHELMHQMGIVDLYQFNVEGTQNNVLDLSGAPYHAGYFYHFPGGLMTGGTNTALEEHTAWALETSVGKRRGYFGEYLFDTPGTVKIEVRDILGAPLSGGTLKVYQRKYIPGTGWGFAAPPTFTLTTNALGQVSLPNTTAPSVTTDTGHTLKPNPYGNINVVGLNGQFFVTANKNNQEHFFFLPLADVNLAAWRGSTSEAMFVFPVPIDQSGVADLTNLAPGKVATASSSATGKPPTFAVDGDTTTLGQQWSPNTNQAGSWWQVDLGAPEKVYRVVVYGSAINPHDWYLKFHAEGSTTGAFTGEQATLFSETDWDAARGGGQMATYTFPSRSLRYLRLVSDQQQNWIGLQEVKVFRMQ